MPFSKDPNLPLKVDPNLKLRPHAHYFKTIVNDWVQSRRRFFASLRMTPRNLIYLNMNFLIMSFAIIIKINFIKVEIDSKIEVFIIRFPVFPSPNLKTGVQLQDNLIRKT